MITSPTGFIATLLYLRVLQNGSIKGDLDDLGPTVFKKNKIENLAKIVNFWPKSPPNYCEFASAKWIRCNQLNNPLYGIFSNLV